LDATFVSRDIRIGVDNNNVHASIGGEIRGHWKRARHGHDSQYIELVILHNNGMDMLVPYTAEIRQGQVLGRRKTAHPKTESRVRFDSFKASSQDSGRVVRGAAGIIGEGRGSVAAPQLRRVAVTN
jgi:hypothetical protein